MPMFESVQREESLLTRKTERLAQAAGVPPELLALAVSVLRMQLEARAACPATEPDPAGPAPIDRVVAGEPLLPRERFSFDSAQACDLFARLSDLLARSGGPAAQAAAIVKEQGQAFVLDALGAYISNDETFFAEFAARTPTAPRTLYFLAQNSLTPQIEAQAEALGGLLPQERTWTAGSCPVCGSAPYLSRLLGKEGVRVCECSFCRASYRVPRLACPYCLESDPKKLPFFVAEALPGYRLDTCESCNCYLKTTDFRDFDLPSLPPLDDLESLALDILAAEKGLKRPTASAFGF